MEAGYEGWRNRPTWAVSLWVNNDKHLYNAFRMSFRDRAFDGYTYPQAWGSVAEEMRSFVENLHEEVSDIINPMIRDAFFISTGTADIDYDAIARNFLSEEDYGEFLAEAM